MFSSFFKFKAEVSRKDFFKLYFLGIIIILAIWIIITSLNLVNSLFIPSPFATLKELLSLFIEKNIIQDIFVTIVRVFIGFLAAMLIGIPLGLFLGNFRKMEIITEPLVNLFRYTPTSALVPLTILWFGIADIQKHFIVFFGAFPFIVLYITNSVASIDKKIHDSARALGANAKAILTKVTFPKSLPDIYEICRIELGGAWGLIILAEIVAATQGLGHRLILAQRFLQTPTLFAELIIIITIGFSFDLLLRKGHKRFFPWSERNQEAK